MPAPVSSRNASLDALRVLGVIGVVAIHASNARMQDPLAFVFDELGRFAVPMFFVLSGFFWKPDELEHPGRLVGRVAWRTLPAYFLFTAIWVVINYLRIPNYQPDLSPTGLFLFFWAGGSADYLWFLPALVVGTALVSFCGRLLGWRITAVLAVLAYLFGCYIGAYGSILTGQGHPFWWFRNGVLFAPVFLVTGVYLRRHRDLVARVPLPAAAIAAIVFAALHLAEGRFALGHTSMGHDFALMTAPYAIAMVLLFMRFTLRGQAWETLGRASFGAYLVHPILLLYMVPAMHDVPLALMILTVAALALALSVAFSAIRARLLPAKRAA